VHAVAHPCQPLTGRRADLPRQPGRLHRRAGRAGRRGRPPDRQPGYKKLVTNHDAFGYYLNRYHLELVGSVIPSFDSSAELSGRDIRDLVARIKATGVRAIFSETSLPPRAAETIAREAGVKVVTSEAGGQGGHRRGSPPRRRPGARAAGGGSATRSLSPRTLDALPPALREGFMQAFSNALTATFRYAVPCILATLVITWLLKEHTHGSGTTSLPSVPTSSGWSRLVRSRPTSNRGRAPGGHGGESGHLRAPVGLDHQPGDAGGGQHAQRIGCIRALSPPTTAGVQRVR
jgi:Zinc-uptake complex component A periplasmic